MYNFAGPGGIDNLVKMVMILTFSRLQCLAEQLTELMGEEVKSETIRKKAYRAGQAGTNVPTHPTLENHTESAGNKKNKSLTKEGKLRQRAPGAGRKPKHDNVKPKKSPSQKMVWRKVEKMLDQLTEYMMAHCETPVDIAALCRSKINQ